MSAGTDWASGGLGTRPSSLRLVRRASRRRQLGADRHRPSQLARLEALTETGKLAEDGEMSGRSEDKRCSGDIVVTRPEQCRMRTSRQDGSVDRRMRGSDRAGSVRARGLAKSRAQAATHARTRRRRQVVGTVRWRRDAQLAAEGAMTSLAARRIPYAVGANGKSNSRRVLKSSPCSPAPLTQSEHDEARALASILRPYVTYPLMARRL